MKSLNYSISIGGIDILASYITKWFDTGQVSSEKYPKTFHPVIHFQSEIGWQHLFTGLLILTISILVPILQIW